MIIVFSIKLIIFMVLYTGRDVVGMDVKPMRIQTAGLFTIERNDVGIVFYLSVRNTGLETYHVVTRMVECCEAITDMDNDCEFMRLLGGTMGYLVPNATKNFTLIFPNMYPYNRRGECLVSVWYRSRKNMSQEVRQRILFDTYISKNYMPRVLKDFAKPYEIKSCVSPDQDPLDNCLPVNCHMKYSGCRSYYNPYSLRCQKIPVCMSDPQKELPDIAYVPMSNTCRDLETAITEDDVQFLTKSDVETVWKVEPPPKISNLRCHHGHLDNSTGLCVCDPGWTSSPFDRDQFNPSTLLYHMCTIQDKPMIWKSLLDMISTHLVSVFLMNFLMSICLIIMIFFGHSFISTYEIARSNNKSTKKSMEKSE